MVQFDRFVLLSLGLLSYTLGIRGLQIGGLEEWKYWVVIFFGILVLVTSISIEDKKNDNNSNIHSE